MIPAFTYYILPRNWDEWEEWCFHIYSAYLDSDNLCRYRRSGQAQHGIDLLGNDSNGRICGVQCKHREADRTLKEDEVLEDVQKAKSYPGPLDRLIFATTAKNEELQLLATCLTKEHKKAGLFTVMIHSWRDICRILNEHPDVRRKILEDAPPAELSVRLQKIENVISASGFRAGADTAHIHEEIDQAFLHTKQGVPQNTIVQLERIRRRRWDQLDDRMKFRVLANIGNAYAAQAEYEKAAQFYLEAVDYQRENEDALALSALAHSFRRDHKMALQVANEVCKQFPHNGRAQSIRIKSLPEDVSLEEALASTPADVLDHPEVSMALYFRATDCDQYEDAELFAAKALESEPDWIEAKLSMATAILQGIGHRAREWYGLKLTGILKARAERARENLDEVVTELGQKDPSGLRSTALYNRSGLNRYLGDAAGAERDLCEAHELSPDDLGIATAYANYLCRSKRFDEAILRLENLANIAKSGKTLMLLAIAHWERRDAEDLERATRILEDGIPEIAEDGGPYRNDWLDLLVAVCSELGDPGRADAVLSRLPEGFASPLMLKVLRESLALGQGPTGDESDLLKNPLQQVANDDPPDELRRLANLLQRAGRFREAVSVYEQFVSEDSVTIDTRPALQCAQECKMHAYMMRVLGRLRSGGVCQREFVEPEVSLLLSYNEEEEAVRALEELLVLHPDDPWAIVNRSLIGLKTDKLELVEDDPSRFPAVGSVDPELGAGIVTILMKRIDRVRAIRYAYSLWRRFPDAPEANRAMICAIFDPHGLEFDLPFPDVVTPGTAVCLAREHADEGRWIIIEDETDPPPSSTRSEFAEDHPLCKAVVGRSKGDQYEDVGGLLKDRKGIIKDIVDKAVFRVRECAANWRQQFPHIPFIEVLKTGPADAKDAQTLLGEGYAALVQAEEAHDQILAEYRNSQIPIPVVARVVGRSVLETMSFLRSDPETLGVRCCAGGKEELDNAFLCCSAGGKLVVEPTALATLFFLDFERLLDQIPLDLIVTRAGLDELSALIIPEERIDRQAENLGLVNGKLFMEKIPRGAILERNERLKGFLKQLSATARTIGGAALSSIDPDLRETTFKALGLGTAEALAAAAAMNAAIWTDDLWIAQFGTGQFRIRSVWSHALLLHLLKSGSISEELAADTTLNLHVHGYKFVGLSPNVILRACVLSHWSPEVEPASGVLKSFGSPDVPEESLLAILFGSMYLIWRNAPRLEAAEKVTICVLEMMKARPDASRLVRQLSNNAERLLGVNILGFQNLQKCLDQWQSGNEGGRIVIP